MGHYLECECGAPIAQKQWRRGKRACNECGMAKMLLNIQSLKARKGEGFEVWASSLRAIIGETGQSIEREDNGSQG